MNEATGNEKSPFFISFPCSTFRNRCGMGPLSLMRRTFANLALFTQNLTLAHSSQEWKQHRVAQKLPVALHMSLLWVCCTPPPPSLLLLTHKSTPHTGLVLLIKSHSHRCTTLWLFPAAQHGVGFEWSHVCPRRLNTLLQHVIHTQMAGCPLACALDTAGLKLY